MSFECHTCRLHLKLQLFLCHRMLKSQFCRTESQRFLTILTGIILSVTNQRHSGMRHLHTNLMMPACIQINPESDFFRHDPVHLLYFSRFPELHKTISPFLLRKSLPQPLQSCWSCRVLQPVHQFCTLHFHCSFCNCKISTSLFFPLSSVYCEIYATFGFRANTRTPSTG